MAFQSLAGGIHFQAEVFDAGEDGVEAAEVGSGVAGDDARQGCFANSGGAMQDQVADTVGLDGSAEETSIRKNPALPLKILQGLRTHPIGEGGETLPLLLPLVGEKVLTQRCGSAATNGAFLIRLEHDLALVHIIPLPAQLMCVSRCA